MGRTTRSKGVLTDQTNIRRKSVEQADQAPKKVCVYQSKDTVEAVNDDELDVYHFEFDSKEEPKRKVKKKRARAQKPAVKRLNNKPVSRSKKTKKSPKPPLRQNVAILSPTVHSTPLRHALVNISSNFEAHVPAALRKNPMPIKEAVSIRSPLTLALPSPIHQIHQSPIHQAPPSPMHHSPIHLNITDNYVPDSPQNLHSRPESPPLANLFDDDDDDAPLIMPQRGPTRFEYSEIVTIRARVIRTSLTRRNVVQLPPQPPRDASPEPSGPKMKQTSILNYVKAPEEEGLFRSLSPVRASSPMQLSMLSPVRAETSSENTRQCPSENEEDERCVGPTRLSSNTLKHVLQANKETLARELPPSPKRRFVKVGFMFNLVIFFKPVKCCDYM